MNVGASAGQERFGAGEFLAEPLDPAIDRVIEPVTDPIIDSGRAWVSALAVSAINGIGFGIAYTFGTFFESMANEFGADKSSTALIFGVTLFFFFGFGVVSGPLADRFGPQPLVVIGALIMVIGLLVTSQAQSLVVGIASYGIGVGIGGGLLLTPAMSSIGPIFDRKRPGAFSLVAVGAGIGVLVLVPLSEWMIAQRDWRDAYVLLAAIAAFGLGLAALAIYSKPGKRGVVSPSVGSLFKLPGFAMLFLVSWLMSIPLFIAFAFIQTFAVEDGVSVSNAALLVSLVGLASIVGRIGLTALVRRVGAIRVLRGALVIHAAAYVLWYFAEGDLNRLMVFAMLFGASYGGYVAVAPEALVTLSGLAGLGKSMGMLLLAFGLGGLIGPPLAGRLAEESTGHELPIQVCIGLVGTAMLLSFLVRTSSSAQT